MKKSIISVSRRTDIPAFYSTWFMNRIRAGYCVVPNPLNARQISTVRLTLESVHALVFWTRNPRPLLEHLKELDERGYKYYFNYTLMANPNEIDPKSPPEEAAIKTFHKLAEHVGPERVVWRYDPIVLSNVTDVDFHLEAYQRIGTALRGSTTRSVISIVDSYRKITERLNALRLEGITVQSPNVSSDDFSRLMHGLKELADEYQYHIQSCAEEIDLAPFGVLPGKCIDDELLETALGIQVSSAKDRAQRENCGCVVSRDIGSYDSCTFGCVYCYATTSFDKARQNLQNHNPESPSLIGWLDAPEELIEQEKQLGLPGFYE